MFFRKAALRPVPAFATVENRYVQSMEQSLDDDDEKLQESLDRGYHDLDAKQPSVASHAGAVLASLTDELVQALGYFLTVTVYLAFREAFPTRLTMASDDDVAMASATIEADEEIRANDPDEALETDDVVGIAQPAVIAFVQHHVEQALEQGGDEVNLTELDRVYRAVLVQVVALSHAVASPDGIVGPPREMLA